MPTQRLALLLLAFACLATPPLQAAASPPFLPAPPEPRPRFSFADVFLRPDFRGQPQTEFGIWDRFTSLTGGNRPDAGGASGASLRNTVPSGVILTSSGNLYAISALARFVLTDSTPWPVTRAVLQTRVLGQAGVATPTLVASGVSYTPSRRALSDLDASGSDFGGGAFSVLWTWDIPESANVTAFEIRFAFIDIHSSLDAVALDVRGPVAAGGGTSAGSGGEKPELTLADMPAATTNATVTLTGTAVHPAGIKKVTVKRARARRARRALFNSETGTWTFEAPLKEGDNTFLIRAVGRDLKKSKKTRLTVQRTPAL